MESKMKIGVLSDIHDNLENLKKAIETFHSQDVVEVIFCGDFCSPIPAKVLASNFSGKIHCVFGNGDGDRLAIKGFATGDLRNLIIYGEYAVIEIYGRKIAVTHYPFYAKALARNNEYDAVFYGHTHKMDVDTIGKTLCVNPGDVMGLHQSASCGVYDSNTNEIEIINLT
jgi:putative phosphoesterase